MLFCKFAMIVAKTLGPPVEEPITISLGDTTVCIGSVFLVV